MFAFEKSIDIDSNATTVLNAHFVLLNFHIPLYYLVIVNLTNKSWH